MEKRMLTPGEITQATIKTGIKKTSNKPHQTLLLAVMAGIFIALGSHAYIVIMQTMKHLDVGLMKFFGALVFPVGLMLVIMAGGELFTGNNLISIAYIDKKISLKSVFKNWGIVYLGNFIGSVFIAAMLYYAHMYKGGHADTDLALAVAAKKMANPFMAAVIKGFLCNLVVALAVWMATGAKDMSGKILAIWFPIMMFIVSGYEHSVANMFFLTLAKLIGADFTIADMFIRNLIPVTIGNILSGGVFIPIVYYTIYSGSVKKEESSKTA